MTRIFLIVLSGMFSFAPYIQAAPLANTVPVQFVSAQPVADAYQSAMDPGLLFPGYRDGHASLSVTETWFFGSSTTDSGNLQAAAPILPDPPYFEGHASNGPVWAEYFADILGTDATASAFGGTNYAMGGARTNVLSLGFIPPITAQVVGYLSDNGFVADSQALYVFQTAANDLPVAKLEEPEVAKQIMQGAVASTGTFMADLYFAGARNFMLLTLPELPTVPVGAVLPDGTNLVRLANDGFRSIASDFEAMGASVWVVDVHRLVNEVVDDPRAFDLEVAHCSFMGKDALAVIGGDITPEPCEPSVPVDQYMMFDAEHFTTVMHDILAHEALGELCAGRRPIDASPNRPCIVMGNKSAHRELP